MLVFLSLVTPRHHGFVGRGGADRTHFVQVDLIDAVCMLPLWLTLHDGTIPNHGYSSTGRWPFGTRHPSVCEVQALLTIFAETSSFCWTAAVSVFLYLDNRPDMDHACCAGFSPRANQARFLVGSALVAFGYPLVVSLCVWRWAVLGESADSGPRWCFLVQHQPHGTLWRIVAAYGPIWICLAVCAGCYLAVVQWAREVDAATVSFEAGSDIKLLGRSGTGSHEARTRKFLFIPCVFVLLRIWGTANRSYQMIAGTEEGLAGLNQLQALGDPAQGFVNAVFFGLLTQPVRESWWELGCCGWHGGGERGREEEEGGDAG